MTDQYLVDYTVRNITTGDEEDIRVLELTDDEISSFPAEVREQIRAIIRAQGFTTPEGVTTGRIQTSWADDQDQILALLLPYITDRALYDADYTAWEARLLGGNVTDVYPPEDVAERVRAILGEALEGAIENWAEGFWEEFTSATTKADILRHFGGYIESVLETVGDEQEYSRPFMAREEAEA